MKRAKNADFWISAAGAALLFAGLAIAGFLLYADAHVTPLVPIASSDWHARFETGDECDLEDRARPACPAHAQSSLWSSDLRRTSADFSARIASSRTETFWLGLTLAPSTLKSAARASATTLLLPKLNGLVQVWIDGVHQLTYDPSHQKVPLQIALAKNRLNEDRPVAIALGVFPYPHQPVPDVTIQSEEGFFSSLDADRLSRSQVFFSTSQNLIALGLFLVIAGFLWSISATGRTRDYALGAHLGLLIAMTSLLSVDLSFRIFNVQIFESVFFSLLLVEMLLVARFTWTLLKNSRGNSRWEIAVLLSALAGPSVFNSYRWIEEAGASLMTGFILPLTYLSCAIVIAYRYSKLTKHSSRTRREFLALSALSMGLTALAYFFESRQQSGFHVIWSRWINLLILCGLVRVFVKSHLTKASLIELAPKSSYHRQDELPTEVEGWILSLSILKFSTDRRVMSTILSHLWTISQLNDGEVLRADEDSLIVLFGRAGADGARADDFTEDRRLVRALTDMARCLKDLEQRLPILFPARKYSTSILFRAAVLKGFVKPSWHTGETGRAQIPEWLDIEAHQSIHATQALLATDLDAAIRSNDASIVVMNQRDSARLSELISPRARVDLPAHVEAVAYVAGRMSGPGRGVRSSRGAA